MIDAYEYYCHVYKRLYGEDYPVSRETWQSWCRYQRNETEDFDIAIEKREGWSYG